jgi:hypothetical protein
VLSGSPLTLGLTSAELNQITAGTLAIGRNDITTGTVTVSSAVAPTNATALQVITARDILVLANITGGSGGLSLSANQQVTPTAGNFIGVTVRSAAVVSATGTGAVTVQGTGGNSTGNYNLGVRVSGASSRITSAGGNVSVTGNGGGTGASLGNHGVFVPNAGEITAGGGGTVTVVGNGGSGSGASNFGVFAVGTNSRITSAGGTVSVTGTGNTGASPAEAIVLKSGGAITSGSGAAITVTADSATIDGTSSVNSGVGSTTIRTRTAGTQINLGGADVLSGSPLVLGLTNAEINRITAGTLVIGDATSGDMTIDAAITRGSATNVALRSGGSVVFNGGSFNTGGGTLLLDPNGAGSVQPLTTGVDATASVVSFASDLGIVISGTTVNTQYNQFQVAGTVNLTGVNLILSGAYMPSPGDVFTIVSTTGGVVGEFVGLPDGAMIVFNTVNLTVAYTGTTVTLTA